MIPINEKIHWSVIERLGRTAIIDGKRSARSTLPRTCRSAGIAKPGAKANARAAENDPRVAPNDAGRRDADRRLPRPKAQFAFSEVRAVLQFGRRPSGGQKPWSVAAVRSRFSANDRRARRLLALRKIWSMGNAAPR